MYLVIQPISFVVSQAYDLWYFVQASFTTSHLHLHISLTTLLTTSLDTDQPKILLL